MKLLASIHLAHLAQLNFKNAITIKSPLKLQASVMYSAIYYLNQLKIVYETKY